MADINQVCAGGVERAVLAFTVPNFSERSGGFLVELTQKHDRLGNRLGNKLGNKLGNTRDAILQEMRANPRISGNQLALKLAVSTTTVEKHIKQLREEGLIKRIGGTRGHWEVVD